MRFLLDTNVVIGLQREQPGLLARVRRHRVEDFRIPSIVMHELFFGARKGKHTELSLAALEALPFKVLDYDLGDARHSGEIRAALAAAGTPIGPYDLLIAGQGRSRDMVVVTRNVREFSRVPGLQTEDWEA